MTCSVRGCGRDAACDGYDLRWRFVAPYCLDHGKEAVAMEVARRKALGLRRGEGAGGVLRLRAHAPGTCPHGGERRSCREPSCQEKRVWDDDPTIDDEYTRELRAQGYKTFELTGPEYDEGPDETKPRKANETAEPPPRPEEPRASKPGDPGWLSEFFKRMGFRIHRDRQASEPGSK